MEVRMTIEIKDVEFTLSLEEAKELRDKLGELTSVQKATPYWPYTPYSPWWISDVTTTKPYEVTWGDDYKVTCSVSDTVTMEV